MYFFSEVTAQCAVKAGLRAVIGEAVVDFPTKSYTNTTEAFRLIERFIDQWKNNALIHPAIILHSPYACSKETLQKAMDMALKHQVCINIHISETQQEVNDSFQKHIFHRCLAHSDGFFRCSFALPIWFAHENDLNTYLTKTKYSPCPTCKMKLASVFTSSGLMEKGINIAWHDGCQAKINLTCCRDAPGCFAP
jgi:5-methylthioadenosine/S-adenosylhomocysteine deaminase